MLIKNPVVQDVLNFGEDKYYSLTRIFLTYPVDLLLELYAVCKNDMKVFHGYFNSLKQYDIFIMLYASNFERYNKLMSFFFDGEINFIPCKNRDTNEELLIDEKTNIVFDLTSFMIMSRYIMAISNIKEDPARLPNRSKAALKASIIHEQENRDFLIKQNEKDRLAGKFDNQLLKLMTKITVASRFNMDDLRQMKVYEFHRIINEVIGFTYWNFRMNGLFSGNIDISKSKNKKDYNDWFHN
jgi:hypothetical protein